MIVKKVMTVKMADAMMSMRVCHHLTYLLIYSIMATRTDCDRIRFFFRLSENCT